MLESKPHRFGMPGQAKAQGRTTGIQETAGKTGAGERQTGETQTADAERLTPEQKRERALESAGARARANRPPGPPGGPGPRPGGPHPGGGNPGRALVSLSLDDSAKELSTGEVIRRALSYLRGYKFALALAIALSLAGAAASVAIPSFVRMLVACIQEGLAGDIDLAATWRIAASAVAIALASFACGVGERQVMATITLRFAQRLRSDMDNKLDRLPFSYLDAVPKGDTLSRMTNDVDQFTSAISESVGTLVSGTVTVAGSLVMMLITNWAMALAGVLVTLLGFALALLTTRFSQPYYVARQNKLGSLNALIEETFSGHTVVRAYNAEERVGEEFHRRNEELYGYTWRSRFLTSLMVPVMSLTGSLGYVVVCVLGAALALAGYTDMPTIVAFMLYIRLFSNPLTSLAQAFGSLQPAVAAGSRIFGLLSRDEEPDETGKSAHLDPASVRGEVVFDHVRFGYDADTPVIGDFCARVEPGQKVAIVGPTGAGKTTLVNLLMRFYEVQGGSISVDGVPIDDMRREEVRRLFGMVLQDTWLFEGTLRENVAYAHAGEVSDERIMDALEKVGLGHAVRAMPAGLDTVINERSALSVGQRQLVAIARAMLEDAPILILDEATSSVDTRTERDIQRAIDTLTKGRTSFAIAHRLSTIRDADVIFVIQHGDIVETGTHDELMAAGGAYAELYQAQFSGGRSELS
jgi:ATP-binding cassette subfamily B multidrug efflux pump